MEQRDDWHLTEVLEYAHGRGDPFAAAVRATRMAMVITDPKQPDNPIVFCNEAFQQLTGYARDEIIGRNCRFLQGPDTDRAEVAKVREAIDAQSGLAVDLLNYRKDGTSFWNALYLNPVRTDAGEVIFFFASQLDVTDRVTAQQRIAEQKLLVEREVEARTADLAAALEAKTLLLHEVDHRVKNNLTMIGSCAISFARGKTFSARQRYSITCASSSYGSWRGFSKSRYMRSNATVIIVGALATPHPRGPVISADNGRVVIEESITWPTNSLRLSAFARPRAP